jgi:hypothetical protein
MKIIICDIDGTIADITHRLHYIQNKPKNWESFYGTVKDDKPIYPIIDLLRLLNAGVSFSEDVRFVFMSGRKNSTRQDTQDWIREHLPFLDAWSLYMRKDGDYREDFIVKKELLEQLKLDFPEYEIWFALDDRNQVVRMWRDNGITCLQVKDGDY